MEVKLYVGNLAYSTTEADIRQLFAQAGNVASVDLIKDQDSGQSKGFAFVTMGTQEEAEKAIGLFNAFSLADRELKVNAAKPRGERGDNQKRPSALPMAGREQRASAPRPRDERGGYQSRLSAFGSAGNGSSPPSHRRKGGSRGN